MFVSTLIVTSALVLGFCEASPAAKYVLHEKREYQNWLHKSVHKRSKVDANGVLPIRIGLAQHDIEKAHDWLMDIAHPESANYGKHWTAAEVNKAFAPTAETVQTVRDWLINAGIASERLSISDNKGWLAFDASVEEAETLFQTQYYEHQDKNPSKYTIGCDEYYLPEHVQAHIDYVTPGVKHQVYKRSTVNLLDPVAKGFRSTIVIAPPTPPTIGQIHSKVVPVNCSSYVVDADCIRGLYNLPDLNIDRKTFPENTLGIYEGIQQTYSQPDLDLFFKNYAPYIPNGTTPYYTSVDGGVGPSDPAGAGGEAMLDITLAFGLVYPASINFYSVDDPYWSYNAYGFLDTMFDAIDGSFCTYSAFGQKGNNNTVDPVYPDPREGGYTGPLQCGTIQPPKVLSVSYGEGEQYLAPNYNRRQCKEIAKLALQGTTVVVSSGDSGVATNTGAYGFENGCINNKIFTPGMVIDCPYTLVVGATTIKEGVSGYSANPEEAVYAYFSGEDTPYTSGGGFSNIFSRPSYQDQAVKTFFKNADLDYPYYKTTNGKDIGANGGIYNRIGRGYPDVSANGAWWHVYINETLSRYGGTSMAAPIFASVLSILNEARLKAGKSTVGFVHPTFYAHPEAFHDITVGANQGCGIDFAFNATKGWDPVTGLGTPKYDKLKEIFLSLP